MDRCRPAALAMGHTFAKTSHPAPRPEPSPKTEIWAHHLRLKTSRGHHLTAPAPSWPTAPSKASSPGALTSVQVRRDAVRQGGRCREGPASRLGACVRARTCADTHFLTQRRGLGTTVPQQQWARLAPTSWSLSSSPGQGKDKVSPGHKSQRQCSQRNRDASSRRGS